MRKKQQTAKNAVKRTAARLEIQNKRTAEAEAELLKAKQDFEKRCSAGDIHALLIREKSVNGITGRKYWELFQTCVIEEAETSGIITETFVNGISVYSDLFADDVVQSIRETGHIVAEVVRHGKNQVMQ